MNLIFIRHSQSLVNPNIPISSWGLSEEGVVLAKKLSQLEIINTLEVVYSSLQPKAIETATFATEGMNIVLKKDDRLTESTSFTNKFVDIETLKENDKKYYADKNLSINGGETYTQALARFNVALESITLSEKGKSNIGIVSHGNILASFASEYMNLDVNKIAKNLRQPDIAVFNWEDKKFTIPFGVITI